MCAHVCDKMHAYDMQAFVTIMWALDYEMRHHKSFSFFYLSLSLSRSLCVCVCAKNWLQMV